MNGPPIPSDTTFPSVPRGEADPVDPPTETIRFPVRGMTCSACVSRITRALRKIDGVSGVHVDLRNERATVRREPALVSNASLAAAVASAGYEAELTLATPAPPLDDRSVFQRLLGRLR